MVVDYCEKCGIAFKDLISEGSDSGKKELILQHFRIQKVSKGRAQIGNNGFWRTRPQTKSR